jgi:hypothetical protein
MICDEEQKAQDLEREIALMQREGHLGLQQGPPLSSAHNWKAHAKATSACSKGHPCNTEHNRKTHVSPSATTPSSTPRLSKGSTISTSEVPWRHTCK